MPGEIFLQAAKWNVLHDQLVGLAACKHVHREMQSEVRKKEEKLAQIQQLKFFSSTNERLCAFLNLKLLTKIFYVCEDIFLFLFLFVKAPVCETFQEAHLTVCFVFRELSGGLQ